MLPAYKLVLVSIVSSIFLLLGLLIYKFIYPKKIIKPFYLVILLSLLPLISILRAGTYESGDLSLHAKIAMPFYQSLTEGNLIPQWAEGLCAGYGCPDFIFMYILPYYIISFFHFIGFTFIDSIKALLITSFISSGIIMYFWAKEELGKTSGLVASIFYLFAPYHLVNTHFRVDIAEVVSYIFLPLNFLATKKVFELKSKKWFIVQILSITFLMLSHQAVFLSFFPFIVAYGIFIWKRNRFSIKRLIYYFSAIVFSILLSTFYWLPILLEKEYILWGRHAGIFFPNLYEFFYSPWRYGFLFQGPIGQLSFVIGYVQWFVIFISLFLIFKIKHKFRGLLIFSITSFFIIFLAMQSFSKLFWESIPLIKYFQFTSRMLNLTAFFTSVLAGITVLQVNKKWFTIALCFLAILLTILNWGNRRTIPEIDDTYLRRELLSDGNKLGDFTTPTWIKFNELDYIASRNGAIEIIKGDAKVFNIKRSSTLHEYVISVRNITTFKENTFYFPGWSLKVNNKNYLFDFNSKKYPGIINFNLPSGLYYVTLEFIDTPSRNISKKISFLALLVICGYLLFSFQKSSRPKT